MTIAIATIIFVVCAFTCHSLAKSRGANPVFWGVMGLVFGPLAIPFVWMAKTQQHHK